MVFTDLAQRQNREARLFVISLCSSVGTLLAGVAVFYVLVLKPLDAFIAPAYGPGLVRAGEVSDVTALDFAKYWFQLRYNWRPETYRDCKAAVLAHTDDNYRSMIIAEMDRDAALVSTEGISSVLLVTEKRVLGRKGKHLVRVRLTAYHTLTAGAAILEDKLVTMDLLVLSVGMGTEHIALVMANTTGLPAMEGRKTAKR
jgi:hypothetical protein